MQGQHHWADWDGHDRPTFGPPSKKEWQYLQAQIRMYLGQFNSSQHCCGQPVLTLNESFIDTKQEGVVFWTHSHADAN